MFVTNLAMFLLKYLLGGLKMKFEKEGQINFIAEMSEHQIVANEFFGMTLLKSLRKNFDLGNLLINYFDTSGKFLSWVDCYGTFTENADSSKDLFDEDDIIRNKIYEDALQDRLTYFDVKPRMYKSSDVIEAKEYDNSTYVNIMKKVFDAQYSVTMPFGVNAYIQLTCFKSKASQDFSQEEMDVLKNIYVYVANAYKNFKMHERAKIIAQIQAEVISQGERAYLICDQFMHVISHSIAAKDILKDIWGPSVSHEINSSTPCTWLPFLLACDESNNELIYTRIIKDYQFVIHTFDKAYSNGIVDRYHWITINKHVDSKDTCEFDAMQPLTFQERRVAELMHEGLTYKQIAQELVISYHTVKKHVQNIYTKCDIKSRHQLYTCFQENNK